MTSTYGEIKKVPSGTFFCYMFLVKTSPNLSIIIVGDILDLNLRWLGWWIDVFIII
jgi:hypothetical protein